MNNNKIMVCGIPFTLRFFEDNSRADGAMGRMDSKRGEIAISSTLEGDILESTILHEWIHAVLEMNGVDHDEGVAAVLGNELYRNGFPCARGVYCSGQGGREMTKADPKISDAAYDKIIDHLSMMLEDEISDRIWDDISSFILKMTTDTDPRLEVLGKVNQLLVEHGAFDNDDKLYYAFQDLCDIIESELRTKIKQEAGDAE
jgi:hypothetical protein